MNRSEVTERIMESKIQNGIRWSDVATVLGGSKEWVTAACLGQMAFTAEQAAQVAAIFKLPHKAIAVLQVPVARGTLDTPVPSDPLIYRLYEIVSVYGTTLKELIHEEFGDGIMSAIDFRMEVVRQEDDAGDRVGITMSGKFLPYKPY
ncbi:cyanase [Streptomyces sp. NPDC050625]|uniref:cyanase n=1 Tax=Streptomyces sp. NPDC050625 TaxID=3154629 RepID=UPI00342AA65D